MFDIKDPLSVADVFFDSNKESKAKGGGKLSGVDFSENGQYMTFKIKKKGSDWASLYVKETATMKDLDRIDWLKFSSVEWALDNKGFFYSTFPAPKNADKKNMNKKDGAGKETEKLEFNKVYYHKLGSK